MGSPARGLGSNCKLDIVLGGIHINNRKGTRVNIQCVLEMLVDFHNRGLVTAAVTVVGS